MPAVRKVCPVSNRDTETGVQSRNGGGGALLNMAGIVARLGVSLSASPARVRLRVQNLENLVVPVVKTSW